MKMSTAVRRGRAEHVRREKGQTRLYKHKCPVCIEAYKRNKDDRCKACPIQNEVISSLGWRIENKGRKQCAIVFNSAAQHYGVPKRILSEIILNLEAQDD